MSAAVGGGCASAQQLLQLNLLRYQRGCMKGELLFIAPRDPASVPTVGRVPAAALCVNPTECVPNQESTRTRLTRCPSSWEQNSEAPRSQRVRPAAVPCWDQQSARRARTLGPLPLRLISRHQAPPVCGLTPEQPQPRVEGHTLSLLTCAGFLLIQTGRAVASQQALRCRAVDATAELAAYAHRCESCVLDLEWFLLVSF